MSRAQDLLLKLIYSENVLKTHYFQQFGKVKFLLEEPVQPQILEGFHAFKLVTNMLLLQLFQGIYRYFIYVVVFFLRSLLCAQQKRANLIVFELIFCSLVP